MPKITNLFKSVLVSGASGDVGIGIGRILKSENFQNIYGCDINEDSWGICIFDHIVKVSRAEESKYIEEIISIVKKLKIDLFIPSSEAEIKVLISHGKNIEKLLNCKILIADSKTVKIALDKLVTANFLENSSLQYPWTIRADSECPNKFPCIFKPRRGQGSKKLEIVKDVARAKELMHSSENIFQELLLPDDEEYTCGVFRSQSGELRIMLINRILNNGSTAKGTVVDNKEIESYVTTIAEALDIKGAINMQLRMTKNGPILFEINPRLSSTVVFRHKLGFEDLLWAIEDIANVPIRKYHKPIPGIKFFRGSAEYFKN
jgi:carbamoyl-phosphate synthase large subunit